MILYNPIALKIVSLAPLSLINPEVIVNLKLFLEKVDKLCNLTKWILKDYPKVALILMFQNRLRRAILYRHRIRSLLIVKIYLKVLINNLNAKKAINK